VKKEWPHFVNMTESTQKQKQSTYHPVAAKAKTESCMVSLQYFKKQQKKNKNNN